ncbi:MAG: class I SAM-dependent methyltransferase [Spirochaetales bacterium]|nr:class I SAM-dependent methyltransferase [Spirochaetales bacterium]
MGFFEKYIVQCRKPTGRLGRFVGRMMNSGHTKLRHWGLGHLSIMPDAHILDIGCGGGKAMKELANSVPGGKVYGIDYSEDMIKVSKKINHTLIKQGIVEIVHGTVSSLPFTDNMLDIVTAIETYFFWPDLPSDLKEIKRVLKPGGTLLLINESYKDNLFEKRNNKLISFLNMQIHTPDEYRDFLTKAGYDSIELHTIREKNWITAIALKKLP